MKDGEKGDKKERVVEEELTTTICVRKTLFLQNRKMLVSKNEQKKETVL